MTAARKPVPKRPGRPLGDGPTVDLRMRVPRATLDAVDARATDEGRSRDAWVRRAIDKALARARS